MGIAKGIYDMTPVGKQGQAEPGGAVTVGRASRPFEALEEFQVVVDELEEMHRTGLIKIILRHQESTSGRRFIDLVQFLKLK